MRGLLLTLVMALPLLAQAPSTPPATPAAPASPAAPDKTASAAPSADAASPVPVNESWLTGYIDLGYRWRTDVAGSFNTYRGIVDLGSGPKLLGTYFTLTDPKHRAFDQIRVRADSWGGEPYQTFHIDAKKSKLYDFAADYRDIAYFSYEPSYADPLLARGIALNEQSFDTRRHLGSFQLDLLPGNWFIPYFAFERDSGSGSGATTFVTDVNEFPVPNTMRDHTNLYRGGIHFELRRFHVTVEQGGTTFENDQTLFQSPGSINPGNVPTPVFGQTTNLTSLLATYGVGGSSVYSKALFTSNFASWLDLYGQFLYSRPETNVHYQQADTGNLLLQSQLLFYNSQQYVVSAAASLPHTSGSFGAEIRPFRRLRIVQSWLTDRLSNSGLATSNQTLTGVSTSQQITAVLNSSLLNHYSQEETEVYYDLTSKITVRGGYRYVWGEASDAVLPAAGLVSADQAKLRRNAGLGGVILHPTKKISITGEVEGASSGGAYFRTSLYDYQKVRAQARYQALNSLSLTADFTMLNNQNPVPGVNYDYRAQQTSLSFFWAPAGGKVFDFQGSYTRSTMHSEIGYLVPQSLQSATSLYRDNAHTATSLLNLKLPHVSGIAPKLTAGGSFFISSGSRPSSYYQPVATLWLPIGKKVSLFSAWSYYGYGEAFYLYEGFRTNLVTTGVRFTR